MNARTVVPLPARLALLAIVVVFVQIGVFSELPVFGVDAELGPLLVAYVGLLCGSQIGAVCGFLIGLLVDLMLFQTLGLSSLIYTFVGFGAGRARELRDPQGALVPLVVGVLATAVSLVGYSVMEFLLGVNAPVSLRLVREIFFAVLLDAILALPFYALVRASLRAALPEDPRRRRRTYTTGGLSPLSRP